MANMIGKKKNISSIDKYIINFLKENDRSSFGGKDKILFFKELSYMLKGGVSLVDAMDVLASNSDNYAIQEVAKKIGILLRSGSAFSYALNRFPEYFDSGDYYIIKSGEQTGNLHIVLAELAGEYEYIKDIQTRYTSALMYPLVLIIIAIIAVVALFGFVLPGVFDIATGFSNMELPTATVLLKATSDFLVGNWKVLVVSFVIVGLLLLMYFSTEKGKKLLFSKIISFPLIGKMTKQYYLVKWSRYTKLMLSSGLNYVETFSLLREILGIPAYQGLIAGILSGVKNGETISASIPKDSELIPNNVRVLIKVGEETASLNQAFDNILSMYQKELDTIIGRLSKVIEPIMLVVIGAIVVFVAMGVFGLILQIMDGAGV
ncbi:MAG: hypothetical protein CR971_01570 [candidate division SR1 bacterium]|nr:MAG: hypothetical protein CR971_01570 [candidate division SR1 bacterium]